MNLPTVGTGAESKCEPDGLGASAYPHYANWIQFSLGTVPQRQGAGVAGTQTAERQAWEAPFWAALS